MPPIPITIITGFLGSGKTTLILNLIPQLPPTYRLALLKNEFGDLAVDSQLASSASISGVQEILNGCICCNLVGQLGDALSTLRKDVHADRIIIESSGSALPATLAMEVNRLGRETGEYMLDGVIVVIDVENWSGYADTSYTTKLQAQYTDLIVFNKWEGVSERRYEDCLDRVGDLELQVATVKSERGRVEQGVLLGLDSALARKTAAPNANTTHLSNEHKHLHISDHTSEVEVLSVTLTAPPASHLHALDLDALETFLLSAPKDEIYRIKALLTASRPPSSSDGLPCATTNSSNLHRYILNWAFGRWTFTPVKMGTEQTPILPSGEERAGVDGVGMEEPALRMTIISARGEAEKWKKRVNSGGLLKLEGGREGVGLEVIRVS